MKGRGTPKHKRENSAEKHFQKIRREGELNYSVLKTDERIILK
jgi:hypothetical protein